jgi:hypothetical protein
MVVSSIAAAWYHARMTRIFTGLMALCLAIVLGGCTSDPEKQWYKPSGSYTSAEFERDSKACTKKSDLDEECLKQRGWVPLSGDLTRKPAEKPPAGAANKY